MTIEAVLPRPVLDIFTTATATDREGNRHQAASNVPIEFAAALHNMVLAERPSVVVEIGMAMGVTSAAIASALAQNGAGRLISIDPFQSKMWHSIGIATLELSGLLDWHELIEEPDYLALPALLASGIRIDFAYNDGRHDIEYVMLDTFYLDKMMEIGGVLAFNDTAWPPVVQALRFIERHRDYRRLDSGLPPLYAPRGTYAHLAVRAEGKIWRTVGLDDRLKRRPSDLRFLGRLLGRRRDDRYYRKVSAWEPPEGYYRMSRLTAGRRPLDSTGPYARTL